jgi:hypothetical protein
MPQAEELPVAPELAAAATQLAVIKAQPCTSDSSTL